MKVQHRRLIFLGLNLITLGALAAMMLALILGGGKTISEWLMGLCFLLTAPYVVIGFWNSAIGLVLLHVHPRSVRAMPGVAEILDPAPPAAPDCRVALLMTLRNEAPGPIFERLEHMRASLAATGQTAHFTFVILSDSDQPEVLAAETCCFARFESGRATTEPIPFYRHRPHNDGFKAGNIGEFLDARAADFDYFMPLDVDSLIAGPTILRMVATLRAHPEIGILQSLVVGMPSTSAFTRVFQFGMRHGMRVFTAGAAWWTADCGPYWGHNALVRTAAFHEHCRLPRIPGKPPFGGFVLSHDQLEATFMRRAGYEIRVIPVESDSFEINPPTLLDFIRRELRWTQGNMQYFHFLATPGLKLTSRIQLAIAIGMYLAQAAWILMIAVGCIGSLTGNFHFQDLRLGMMLFVGVFFLSVSPKLFGALDVYLSRGAARRYGGRLRFGLSVLAEFISSTLMAPVVALSVTIFLIGLLFGKSVSWGGQNRAQTDLPWRSALAALAPHTAAGLALAAALLAAGGWTAVLWGLPIITGLALAAPYAVFTARSSVGRCLSRLRLFGIPEEQATPTILARPSAEPALPAALRR